MTETRDRILDVAIDVLGRDPEAGMGEIASAAGVVRRTVYGHFPTRADLVRTLTQRAVGEIAAALAAADGPDAEPDAIWVDYVTRLWPLTHRYRALLALRRGEHGPEIHALLLPVERALADLVARGQDRGVFGRHLPADVLSRVAQTAVFSIADDDRADGPGAATITSLLVLGVSASDATALVTDR